MRPLHELAARIGLDATASYGFALAGGYAIQAHGFLVRKSEDVDLFTTAGAPGGSPLELMLLSPHTERLVWWSQSGQ